MLYCLGIQNENVVLFRGSECFLLKGFRILFIVQVLELRIVQECRICFIVQGFRMLYCSGGF